MDIESDKCLFSDLDSECANLSSSGDESDTSSDESTGDLSEAESEENFGDCRKWLPVDGTAPAPPRFPFTGDVGAINAVPARGNVLDYFNLFFDDVIDIIVQETNRYAVQEKARNWVNTTSDEIRVFLALVMLQGLTPKPIMWQYWSRQRIIETAFFGQCMSYKRFQALKRHLHFSDNAQFDAETHPNSKLNKIFPVYELLVRKFQSLYMPGRDVTIDESLMLYKGRLGWVQYIPLKRARFGIKLFLLCESKSGYVWSMIIYTGKGTQLNPLYEGMPVSSQVVLSLMQPLLGNEHCVITDNFYTSPQLVDHLINNDTDIYGTVKPTRKEMPPEMKKKKSKKEKFRHFNEGR